MIKSHLLYQLSYGVRFFRFCDCKVNTIFSIHKIYLHFLSYIIINIPQPIPISRIISSNTSKKFFVFIALSFLGLLFLFSLSEAG